MRTINFNAGYHEWNLFISNKFAYSFGDFADEMCNENLSFEENLEIAIDDLVDSMLECAKDDFSDLPKSQRNLILKLTEEEIECIKQQMRIRLTSYYKMEV